jgi:hypothetical protein
MPGWGRETTLNDAIRGWRDNGWDDLSLTTTERYEQIWRMYIADGLGRRGLAEIADPATTTPLRQALDHLATRSGLAA